jgi:copper chaperone CopZ
MIMQLKFLLIAIIFTSAYSSVEAQISKAEIVATGLTCSMCSNAINKQLKSLAEVDSVVIDLNTNTFVVHLNKESKCQPRDVERKG